jgi:light-regulated signal transduction histidine kinase (bacteriophytochrome)
MIEDILNYSNINASENLVESLDLTDILNDIESDLEVLIQQNHAAIYFVPLPKIEGAPVLIHQLFYNLIHNSLKFSKPDVKQEISIQSKTDPETLHVKITPIKNVPGAKPFNPCQVAHIEPATGIIFLLRACVHEA